MQKLAVAVVGLGIATAILLLAPIYPVANTHPCGNQEHLGAVCLPIFAPHTVFNSVSCIVGAVGAIYVPSAGYHLGCSA